MEPRDKPRTRAIRVFISSTFLDMKEERDHLVKFIFPQLRRLCEHRGVVWGEVDLRWGVTDEEKAEGKVLPICLEEIRRCRPYFIGLLGERYGWIPDAISPEVIEREPWLKEHLHGRKSVTELEILHGVLNNPEMAEHAFFYLRTPAYVDSLPPQKKKDFTAENAEGAEKLKELKDRIRQSGFPVREDYGDPKALGELVLADLTAVIDRLFPEGSQPDPLDREAMDHEAYAQSRARVYIGRQEYFDRLDAHAASDDGWPLVVLGESGGGKSVLLANWAIRYRQAHPQALVLEHYIGATPYSADWAAMLRRIMGEFKRRLGIQQDIPDNPDALRGAFANWLHMAAAKGRVVLILDALNQLEDRDGAPDLVWLPPVMPANVRLIVSTLPGRPLDEIGKRGWPAMEVKPLDANERKELIGRYLGQYAKTLSPTRVERIASAPQSANPLYLRVLLDELRLFGEHERLGERIEHYLQACSPYELYGKVIARWEEDYEDNTDLVGDSLSLLWAARRGLSESELLDAMGRDGQPLARATWSPLYLAMSDGLISRAGLLTFAHDFLRTAARDACIPTEEQQKKTHLFLADYFGRQVIDPRPTDELPWQLSRAQSWQRLYDLLLDPLFFLYAWQTNMYEVKGYWVEIKAHLHLPGRSMPEDLRLQSLLRRDLRPEMPAKLFIAYLEMIAVLLAATGEEKMVIDFQHRLSTHARKDGDMSRLVETLQNESESLVSLGELTNAMALRKEQEALCRQVGDQDSLATCLVSQANILLLQGELDRALELHKEAESIFRQLGRREGIAVALAGQAKILCTRGDLEDAMNLVVEGEQIFREIGRPDGVAGSLVTMATILSKQSKASEAHHLLGKAERMYRALGDRRSLSRVLAGEALFLVDQGKPDAACDPAQESAQILRDLNDQSALKHKTALASLNDRLAHVYVSRGDMARAMVLAKEEHRLRGEVGDKKGMLECLRMQAAILADWGDCHGAMDLHRQEEGLCREIGDKDDLARCLAGQSLVLAQGMGKPQEALPLAREAYQVARSVGLTVVVDLMQSVFGKVLLDKGDPLLP